MPLAVHQYLAKHGEAPSYLERSAAWASEEASIPQVWAQLPPQLRSSMADEGAELAMVAAKAPDLSTAEQFYKANLSSFWSQVCLTSVDVSVPGRGGTIDMAASQKQAEAVAAELTAASAGGAVPTVGNGARYCLTPEQSSCSRRRSARRSTRWRLARPALVPQSWGYEVVQVRSRTHHPVQQPGGGRNRCGGARRRPDGLHVASSGRRPRPVYQHPESGERQGRPEPTVRGRRRCRRRPTSPRCGRRARLPPEPWRARPKVTVVGLGPGRPGLVTAEALAAIETTPVRWLRTSRHPSAVTVPGARSFDYLYESAATFEEVYSGIVDALVESATSEGSIVYAVPGSPAVAERTVELLRADPRVETVVLPGVSFADLAFERLGVDPLAAGVRVVDGHRFASRSPVRRARCWLASAIRPRCCPR